MYDKTTDTLEDDLNMIRLSLYEKTKDMTAEEKIAFIQTETEPVMKQFGIKMSNLKPVAPRKQSVAMTV